jgi:aminopeptidase N
MIRSFIIALGLTTTVASADPINLSDLSPTGRGEELHDRHTHGQSIKIIEDRENPVLRHANFDVKDYNLDLAIDPVSGEIKGTAIVSAVTTETDVSEIVLDAVDMEITDVNVRGANLSHFENEGTLLRIVLREPVASHQHLTIDINYETPQAQVLHRSSPNLVHPDVLTAAYTYTEPLGSRYWFPCLDRPNDKATASIRLTVPAPNAAISNGNLIERSSSNGQNTFAYRMDEPLATYLISVVIGEYEIRSLGQYKSVPLPLWASPKLADQAESAAERTAQMMQVFSDFTGYEYPFQTYAQAVAPAWQGSMEHQTASTMGGSVMTGDKSGEWVVAHELAHQWFGDWVTCERWEELWLNEGFATYLPLVFWEKTNDEVNRVSSVDANRNAYFGESRTKVRAVSSNQVHPEDIFDAHDYDKSAMLIRNMRFEINRLKPAATGQPESFTLALSTYLQRHGRGTARNQDLQRIFEEITGTSWQLYFEQWIRSAGHPILTANYTTTENTVTLHTRQEQSLRAENRWRSFVIPLPVELVYADGTVEQKIIQIYQDTQSTRIHITKPVVGLNLDPDWQVLAEITLAQPQEAWLSVFKQSSSTTSRIHSLRRAFLISKEEQRTQWLAAIKAQRSNLEIMTAITLLSADKANFDTIRDLFATLVFRNPRHRLEAGAISKAELWLYQNRATPPETADIERFKHRYNLAPIAEQRKDLLDMIYFVSADEAFRFAQEKLAESQWAPRDRRNIIDLLTRKVTDANRGFVRRAVTEANEFYRNRLLNNLISSKYDDAELVEPLLHAAQTEKQFYVRINSVRLLAEQKSSKEVVCPRLDALSEMTGEGLALNSESLESIRGTLNTAKQTLCK